MQRGIYLLILVGDETEAVFADLGLSVKEYPKVQTTWQN
jgi:hypothetical protein